MPSKILEMREKRAGLIAEGRKMVDAAERERRGLRADEQKGFDTLLAEAQTLKQTIERQETLEREERELAMTDRERNGGRGRLDGDRPNDPPASGSDEWCDAATGRVIRSFGPKDGSLREHAARSSGDDYRGLRLGQFLRAMVVGPKSEIERRALSEGTDSAGGFTTPDILARELIDLLRAKAVTLRAGARILTLESDKTTIARLATDPVATWRAENAAVAESDPTFSAVVLAPKTLAVIVRASRELIEDSLNIENGLTTALAGALSAELDRVALV